jgi:hypothetical protein
MSYVQTMYLRITLNALLHTHSEGNKDRFVHGAKQAVQKIDQLKQPLKTAIEYLSAKAELTNTWLSSAEEFLLNMKTALTSIENFAGQSKEEANRLCAVTIEKPVYRAKLKIENGQVVDGLEYQLI